MSDEWDDPPGQPIESWLYVAVAGGVLLTTAPLHVWQHWRERRARSRRASRERVARARVEHEQRCGGLGHQLAAETPWEAK